MSGLRFEIDPRWSRARGAPRPGVKAALKRWLGIVEPEEGRKLDIRRPTGADPNVAPVYRTRR